MNLSLLAYFEEAKGALKMGLVRQKCQFPLFMRIGILFR
jgi:hypothetical protein